MPLPIHIPLPRLAENVPVHLKEEAVLKMLAADVHLGGRNLNHRQVHLGKRAPGRQEPQPQVPHHRSPHQGQPGRCPLLGSLLGAASVATWAP